ncbi:MAG: alpha/beta fold hydrolase [Flavobacteriales bacterium]|jgi:pimeloyl-ACP methyl ester carboxylesterase|nr:alpha/beta fold hydrolase [Flavobacteriales bacterium]
MSAVELFFRRSGRVGATPVVILHGLFGTSDNWGSVGRELAEPSDTAIPALDVILVDLRDHGRSPHTDAISYPIMADDVHALFQRLGLRDVVLVGHSMGGKVAMTFAQCWPELLRKLVVVDISPREHENNHAHIIEALRTADLAPGRTRKEVEAHITTLVKEPGVVQFLMKNLYWHTEDQLGWRVNATLLERELPAILAAIGPEKVRVPTVFIRGGQSDYILREDLPAIKEQFPNSVVETVPFAGHWVHAQAPDEVVAIIRASAAT